MKEVISQGGWTVLDNGNLTHTCGMFWRTTTLIKDYKCESCGSQADEYLQLLSDFFRMEYARTQAKKSE